MGRGSNGSLLVAEDAEAYATMVSELRQNLDTMFLLVMGAIICFLQSGFGMLEAGSVRQKNVSNILSKNFADLCLGVTFFGAIGYGLAFGKGNQWVGPAPGLLSPRLAWSTSGAPACRGTCCRTPSCSPPSRPPAPPSSPAPWPSAATTSATWCSGASLLRLTLPSALVTGVFYPIQVAHLSLVTSHLSPVTCYFSLAFRTCILW